MNDRGTQALERRMGDRVRARLHPYLAEFVMFVLKQGWACLFGILLLIALIATKLVWPTGFGIARYDLLVVLAIAIQVVFLRFGLETWDEARVILLFHLTGTAMEIFKVQMGSWSYPEAGLLKLAGVPLFSGFMYASVGSYIARVTRIFGMKFAPFPPFWVVFTFACAIYLNFFTHHYLPDLRWLLIALTVILFVRTRVWFIVHQHPRWMPMPLAAFLAAFFLWVAENVGTFTGTWVYARQGTWEMVSLSKLGAWYMLLWVAFASVTLVIRQMLVAGPLHIDGNGRLVGATQGDRHETALSAHDGPRP